MTVHCWRIVKAKHAGTAFSGSGAKTNGGRWNSPGTAIIYTAGSVSLAMLEMLVHLEFQDLMQRYVLFEITFEESLSTTLHPAELPRTWRKSPASRALQRLGDAWADRAESAVLKVPSVIVPTEWNYLLNPNHIGFKRITIGPKQPMKLDRRLAKPV